MRNRLALLKIVLALACLNTELSAKAAAPALKQDFGAGAVGLPPLPQPRTTAYQFYRLEFLPDGYPGRLLKNGKTVPHPIYGTYVIRDYIGLYTKTDDRRYLDAAKRVADATITRMDSIDGFDALAYYYDPNNGLTNLPRRFYSGLTQARYLAAFQMLYEASREEKYRVVARKIFNSLKVPSPQGGVLVESSYGTTLEEFPHEIPTYVLNGWTTIILELVRYEKATQDPEAARLIQDNLSTLEKLLPRYDYPELFLSRYQLTGSARLKFVFHQPNMCKITAFGTYVDGIRYSASSGSTSRWDNHVVPEKTDQDGYPTSSEILVNGVFSAINDRQRYDFSADCKDAAKVQTYIGVSKYDVFHSSVLPEQWVKIDERHLPKGASTSTVEPENEPFKLVAYPTNFYKNIGGKRYNVYHWLHITNLDRLANETGSEILRTWSGRWHDYTREWAKSAIIAQPNVSFECYPGPCTTGVSDKPDEGED